MVWCVSKLNLASLSLCLLRSCVSCGLIFYFPFLRFHFYTSHPPCGDATIAPKRVTETSGPDPEVGPVESSGIRADQISSVSKPGDGGTGSDARLDNVFKRYHDDDGYGPVAAKRPKAVDNDIHRTGAKSVEGLDPHGLGFEYHAVGVVRTKPGKTLLKKYDNLFSLLFLTNVNAHVFKFEG